MLMAIDPFFGSVLAAGSSLAGGLVGAANADNINSRARDEAANNAARQMHLAQHGITMRARDVMNAYSQTGIHPLALLGVQGPTYSPSSAAFVSSPIGDAVGKMGQDVAGGMWRTADKDLRERSLATQAGALKLAQERGELENTALRIKILSDIARLKNESSPVMPSPGGTWKDAGTPRAGSPGSESPIPGIGLQRMPDGTLMMTKSKAGSDMLEDDVFGNLKHFFQRMLFTDPGGGFFPPPPRGKHWRQDWKGDLYLDDTPYSPRRGSDERYERRFKSGWSR